MNSSDTEEARRLRGELADALEKSGDLAAPEWRRVFEAVPRHAFVPGFFTGPDRLVTAADEDWLKLVYSDDALVTQMTDGIATSSSTAPGLMLAMLQALDVEDGNTVLEVAVGTGYNLALLAERLGAAQVFGIEVDAGLARLAEERLTGCGYTPTVVAGDGRSGYRLGAPYDRLIATCGFTTVPYPWVEQMRPGGVIVCPLGSGTVRLVVDEAGEASGRFLAVPSYFMGVREAGATGAAAYPGTPEATRDRATALPPSALFAGDAFPFLLSLTVPGLVMSSELDEGRNVVGCRLWTPDGSWAQVQGGTVRQAGPRPLWDAVEYAHDLYEHQGRPGRERFGATVTAEGQRLWLDDPGQPWHT